MKVILQAFFATGKTRKCCSILPREQSKKGDDLLENRLLSNKSQCTKISLDKISVIQDLNSDHEEAADTKLVALACAANVSPGHAMMNRSPSGDIDVLALFVAHNFDGGKVLIDNRTGKTRKIIDVTSSTLDTQKQWRRVKVFVGGARQNYDIIFT